MKKKKAIIVRPIGRPSTVTPDVLAKLEYAFSIDASVEEALSLAEIKPDAYYDYLKKNPEFAERIKMLRQQPILKARQRVVRGVEENYQNAMDYLKRKLKNEFSERQEHIGMIGVFSMSDLRRKLKEHSINIIQNDDTI